MDADNGRDNRVSDFALIRKWSSHASSLVLTLDGAIPSGYAHRHALVTSLRRISHARTSVNINIRWRHAWQAPDSGCDLPCFYFRNTQAISTRSLFVKNANLSTSSMEYSSWHLLNRVNALTAVTAASAILNLSERRVDSVKSGSIRCADEFK